MSLTERSSFCRVSVAGIGLIFYNLEMRSVTTRSKKFALLAVAAIALAACGGSSENSSTASTVARTKNAALPTETTVSTPSCATGGVCVVGDIGPGGGKVFYVAPTSFTSTGSACGSACKYLEVARVGWIVAKTPAGQTNCNIPGTNLEDPKCQWSTNYTARIGTTSYDIGAGYANTSAMITQSLGSEAAMVARGFQGGGKTDWYLPSFDELNLLYLQRYQMGRFSFGGYWSSSEGFANLAWTQDFVNGTKLSKGGFQNSTGKSNAFSVRPVRAF